MQITIRYAGQTEIAVYKMFIFASIYLKDKIPLKTDLAINPHGFATASSAKAAPPYDVFFPICCIRYTGSQEEEASEEEITVPANCVADLERMYLRWF